MAHRRQSGFSLIEILVVLVLISLLFGLVGGSIYRNLDSVKIRRSGKEVLNGLRYVRAQSIVTHEEQFLEVDLENRTWQAADRAPQELPDGVDITLRTASMDILDDQRGRIRFYPDGSSTGGRITLLAGDRVWRINVGWLTGEIALESGDTDGRGR